MPRLIDAEELLKHAYDSGAWKDAETGYHQRVVDIEDIEDVPTVDAEPVRHGHWISASPLTDTWECSECQYNIIDEAFKTPYCPICGAKMDEEA